MSQTVPGAVPAQALILAAGLGRRLGESGGENGPDHLRRPKAMLDFGGTSLLARHFSILRYAGIARITVLIGFAAEHIRVAVA